MTRALTLARAFAERTAMAPSAADSLALIIEEWLNNIVEHGRAAPGARIALSLQHAPGLLRLTVSDAGVAFDPRTVEFVGPNPERGGGVGLTMIRAWCRIAAYRRTGGRNRLVFEMSLP